MSQLGLLFPIYGKIKKNVPKHHPDDHHFPWFNGTGGINQWINQWLE